MAYHHDDARYAQPRQGYQHPAQERRAPQYSQYADQQPHVNHQHGRQHQQYYNMEGNNRLPKTQQLGATFYPGGNDDFYMPEVVSPTPQRVMPEVPSNMQEGLAHLEFEARSPQDNRVSSQSTVSSIQSPYLDQNNSQHTSGSSQSSAAQRPSGPQYTASYENTNASAYQNIRDSAQSFRGLRGDPESPKFSPFPKLHNAGPNVPLSDDEKEEVLERARSLVLKSTDPEMQLAWAQDALSWVEVASQAYTRLLLEGQSARSATPQVEHQLRIDALSIVNFLADQHHPKAEFMKGMWLEFGKFGYRMDKKEAFLSYRRAAEKGYARAEYRIGMQYESSNDSAKAIKHYSRGVAMKDSASNYRLGMMTLLGQHGQPQDYQMGVDLIQFAADTADENAPQGAYIYGMLLARELPNINIPEQFLPYDLNDAKLYIEKAAYLGFAKAQLKMAQAYELCQLGCDFEPPLSLHYNALAARQGEAEADMAISKWFLCGYEGIFEKNEELAFTYAKRAAQTKMATAEFAMGYFYEIGMYVPVDLAESESWYQKAAEHGNKDALGRIDSIKKNNTLSKKDHEQVAISRIKSTYGSQRGRRPDRFKKRPPPLSSMTEERVDMPDPRKSYAAPGSGGQLRPGSNSPLPLRPASTAPYPEDDVAPRAGQPYPSPTYNQGLRPSAGPQADRPSSAFGIRPSTSMGNMRAQAGRGSNPMGRNQAISTGWESQIPPNYREPLSPNRPPTLPQVDVAPTNFDQGGNRRQPLNVNRPYSQAPQPPSPGYGPDLSQKPLLQQGYNNSIPRRDPAANSFHRPERGSSMMPVASLVNPALNQRPERFDSMTPVSGPSRASQRITQTMSSTMSSQQGPDSRSSSAAGSVASLPPKRTGPATFEEMGIPAGKNDSDCIIM